MPPIEAQAIALAFWVFLIASGWGLAILFLAWLRAKDEERPRSEDSEPLQWRFPDDKEM